MTPIDSWILIAFVFSCGIVFVLSIDIFLGWIVRRVNELRMRASLKRWLGV